MSVCICGLCYAQRAVSLRSLGLKFCIQLTDSGLRSISNAVALRNIERVEVAGCRMVSDRGVEYLSKCTALRRLSLAVRVHSLSLSPCCP